MNLVAGLPVAAIVAALTWYGRSSLDPLGPDLVRLAHRDPDVRVHEVGALDAVLDRVGERDAGTGRRGDLPGTRRRAPARASAPWARPDARPCPASRRRRAASCPCCSARRRGTRRRSARAASSACSRMVSMSARIWVGWNSSVRPFQTGTPAKAASVSTMSWSKPRYSMPSYSRPRTRAVSLIDSLWPICEDCRVEVRHVRALVVRGHLERAACARRRLLEDQADLLLAKVLLSVPSRLAALSSAARSSRYSISSGRVVEQLEEVAAAQAGHRRRHRCRPPWCRSRRGRGSGRIARGSGRSCSGRRRGRDPAPSRRG